MDTWFSNHGLQKLAKIPLLGHIFKKRLSTRVELAFLFAHPLISISSVSKEELESIRVESVEAVRMNQFSLFF